MSERSLDATQEYLGTWVAIYRRTRITVSEVGDHEAFNNPVVYRMLYGHTFELLRRYIVSHSNFVSHTHRTFLHVVRQVRISIEHPRQRIKDLIVGFAKEIG